MSNNMLGKSWALARKDLRSYFRDRMGLLLGFLVPIAMVTVFGWIMAYAFGGSGGMPKVTLWLVDEDNSALSRQFVSNLRSSNMLEILPKESSSESKKTRGYEELRKLIAAGDAHHALRIPKGFGEESAAGRVPDFSMLRDPGRTMEDRIIQMALMQAFMSNSGGNLWKDSLHRMFEKEGMQSSELSQLDSSLTDASEHIRKFLARDDKENKTKIANPSGDEVKGNKEPQVASPSGEKRTDSTKESVSDPLDFMGKMIPMNNEDIVPPSRSKKITFQQAQSVSGISVMMLLFGLTNAGALLIGEREQGTLRRLLSLPMQRESVLLGKFFYVAVVGLMQMSVLMIYGELLFKVGMFRDCTTLAILVVSWVATAGSFGMAIATFAISAKQADGLSTIIILVMAALGGCWFPVQMMTLPLPLEIASKSTMTYWAMEGFQGMLWSGMSWLEPKMLKAIGIQWLWTGILSGLSVYWFRRNYLA